MRVYTAVLRRRSIRRFKQKKVPFAILQRLIQAARLAPSAGNLQPCEFIVVERKETVETIFPALSWAGYIQPQGNPPEGFRPCAYIVVLVNRRKSKESLAEADAAAAVENILLVAEEEGLGSCWLGAIDKVRIARILKIPRYCQVKYVVALGYADEKPQVERVKGSLRYWKDRKGILHVPKRSLKDVLHRNIYQDKRVKK